MLTFTHTCAKIWSEINLEAKNTRRTVINIFLNFLKLRKYTNDTAFLKNVEKAFNKRL